MVTPVSKNNQLVYTYSTSKTEAAFLKSAAAAGEAQKITVEKDGRIHIEVKNNSMGKKAHVYNLYLKAGQMTAAAKAFFQKLKDKNVAGDWDKILGAKPEVIAPKTAVEAVKTAVKVETEQCREVAVVNTLTARNLADMKVVSKP